MSQETSRPSLLGIGDRSQDYTPTGDRRSGLGRRFLYCVIAGLVPAIHVFRVPQKNTWMAGTSPAMTVLGRTDRSSRGAATGYRMGSPTRFRRDADPWTATTT